MDQYDIAHLTGGPSRVVLTAIVALHGSGAVRITNPLLPRALARLRSMQHMDDVEPFRSIQHTDAPAAFGALQRKVLRMNEALVIGEDRGVAGATRVSPGTAEPAHPVEAAVAQELLRKGFPDKARLITLPAICVIPERLAALGIATADNGARERIRRWMGRGRTGIPQTWAEIHRRMRSARLYDILLSDRITGYPARLPCDTATAVALEGEVAVWAADPVLAASLGRLASLSASYGYVDWAVGGG